MLESTKIDRRVLRSKTAFRDALITLLKQKDYDSISVTDIVDVAGYSRGAFYSHFQDKKDFLESLLEDEIDKYVEIICSTIAKYKSIEYSYVGSTYEPALNFFQYIYENRELYKIIFDGNFHVPTLDYFCESAYERFMKKLDISLEYEATDFNKTFKFYTDTYMFMIYVKFWIKNDFKYSPQYMADQVTFYLTNKTKRVFTK